MKTKATLPQIEAGRLIRRNGMPGSVSGCPAAMPNFEPLAHLPN